jgi:cold shock CspA family protein
MQTPVEITYHRCEPSESIRNEIEKQARRLEQFSPRITSCRVVVNGPGTRHRSGGRFKVDIRIAMPQHNDVIVGKTHDDAPEQEHVLVAIRDAFDAAVRQIEDVQRNLRGQVKAHAPESRGRVAKFVTGGDYGFIETPEGREVYFHRNAVAEGAFDRLSVGAEVCFVEEAGEKGPQASVVWFHERSN